MDVIKIFGWVIFIIGALLFFGPLITWFLPMHMVGFLPLIITWTWFPGLMCMMVGAYLIRR